MSIIKKEVKIINSIKGKKMKNLTNIAKPVLFTAVGLAANLAVAAETATSLNSRLSGVGEGIFSKDNVELVSKGLMMAGIAMLIYGAYKWVTTQEFSKEVKN